MKERVDLEEERVDLEEERVNCYFKNGCFLNFFYPFFLKFIAQLTSKNHLFFLKILQYLFHLPLSLFHLCL